MEIQPSPFSQHVSGARYRGLYSLAFALAACGTDVAQTARPGEVPPLDCAAPGALSWPSDVAFGDGKEPPWELLGPSYEAGEGPGLHITARDAFRVYLDGKLVVESAAARQPRFVPLSLLPGKNALSVVVSAKAGTPVALLQLDELERSHVSQSEWKVSSAPAAGFGLNDYDDSKWQAATDYGVLSALPGCADVNVVPATSLAHWIGPSAPASAVVLRTVIEVNPVGFGAATTGGAGAVPVLVDSWEKLQELAEESVEPAVILLGEGVHDFRTTPRDQDVCPSVCSSDASKLIYSVLVNGATCAEALETRTRTERTLTLGSNKTLIGLGRGAQLRGVTLYFNGNQNVIVRNLTLYDINPDLVEANDAFGFKDTANVWLDHCTVKWISDSFSDLLGGTNVTVSWLHYDGVSLSTCRGEHLQAMQLTDITATVHHTFFDHVESHSPRVDNATSRVHLFGNLFADNFGYAVSSVCGAQVLAEANTFERVSTPTSRSTCADGTSLGLIDAPPGSNFYGEDVGAHHGGDGLEPHDPVFVPPYDYELGDPETEWRDVFARAGTGGLWAQPLSLD